jgi:hypothetical protein
MEDARMRRFTAFASLVSLIPLILASAARAQYQAPAGYEIVPLIDTNTGLPLKPDGLAVSSSGELAVTNGNTVTLYNTWQNGRSVVASVTDSAWVYDTDPVFLNNSTILFGENGNTDALWSVNFATPLPTISQVTPDFDLPDIEGVSVLDATHAIVSGQNPTPPATSGALYLDKVDLTDGNISSIASGIGSGYPGNPAVTPAGNLALLEADSDTGSSYVHLYNSANSPLTDVALDNGEGYGAYGIASDSAGISYITTGNTITAVSGIDSLSPVVSQFGIADPTYQQYLTSISFTGGSFVAGQAGDTGALIVNDGGFDSGGAFAIIVPEPGSAALLAAAAILGLRKRRSR